jgi:Apea-like HEPN
MNMSDDLVASRLTTWVRHYVRGVTSDELVSLGTGDTPLEVAVHGVLADRAYQAACRAFENDAVIAPLLTVSGGTSPILYAPWTRVFLWADQLPMRILAAAALEAALNGVPLSSEATEGGCLRNLAATRAICKGRPYSATVATAISGVTLPPNMELATSLGRVTEINSDLGIVLVGRQPTTTMVVSKIPIKVAIHPHSDPSGRVDRGTTDSLSWLSTRICAAFLLAVESDRDICPLVSSQTVVVPFSPWTSSMSPYHDDRGDLEIALEEDQGPRLQQVCNALASPSANNIRIAVERALAASTERVDASDVLIDSVIAWENLVGTSLETSFRLAAALSWLLAPASFKVRANISRELKRLYGRRSRVVHGAKVDRDDVEHDARLALKISREALSRMLLDHAWLAEVSESSERNDAILLGDPRFRREGEE